MREERREYKGIEIVARTPEGAPAGDHTAEAASLHVDGVPVAATIDEMTGRVWNWQLPYEDYASLMELAEVLVDRVHAPLREDQS